MRSLAVRDGRSARGRPPSRPRATQLPGLRSTVELLRTLPPLAAPAHLRQRLLAIPDAPRR